MKSNSAQINYGKKPFDTGTDRAENMFVSWVKERAFTLILVSMMVVGIGLLAYPTFADYWNSLFQSRAVMSYAEYISNMTDEEYAQLLKEAREYNEILTKRGISWAMSEEARAKYKATLNASSTGIMGYIQIRKIDILLPIYHGTEEDVLQTSIGHLEQSSFPVGGEGTHCMLSGHRGLPSARLFSDLDKLKEGDTFSLTVLNETLSYEIDHIWIVDPSDYSHLQIEEGRDLCTLITCTPYGVNTHRLLLQGHRIPNADGEAMVIADAIQIQPVFIAPFLALPILVVLLIYVLISTSMKYRKRRNLKEQYFAEKGLKVKEQAIEDQVIVLDAVQQFLGMRYKRNGKDYNDRE